MIKRIWIVALFQFAAFNKGVCEDIASSVANSERVAITTETRGLPDTIDSLLLSIDLSGSVMQGSALFGDANNRAFKKDIWLICWIRCAKNHVIRESVIVEVNPRVDGMILAPQDVLLPKNRAAFPLLIKLERIAALGRWRAGRRGAPDPIDVSRIEEVKLLFFADGKELGIDSDESNDAVRSKKSIDRETKVSEKQRCQES